MFYSGFLFSAKSSFTLRKLKENEIIIFIIKSQTAIFLHWLHFVQMKVFFSLRTIPKIHFFLYLKMALFNYGTSKKAVDWLTHITFLLVHLFKESHKEEKSQHGIYVNDWWKNIK